MTTVLVDTNIFVRHFTQDDPSSSALAATFLKRAEAGLVEVSVTESVLLELEHVLTSRALPYQIDRQGMIAVFQAILGLAGLRLSKDDRLAYGKAVEIYERHQIDFGDSLLAARVLLAPQGELLTLDRHHFDKVREVARHELEVYDQRVP